MRVPYTDGYHMPSDQQSLSHRRFGHDAWIELLCGGLILGVLLLDLETQAINYSIFYILPLIIRARLIGLKGLMTCCFGLIGLTFLGYAWDFRDVLFDNPQAMGNYRLLNRSLVAGMLLVATLLVRWWISFRISWENSHPANSIDVGSDLFERLFRGFENLLAGILCALVVVINLAIDLLTPSQTNLGIIYVVPLLIAGFLGSRTMLWILLPVLIGLTLGGFFLDPGIMHHANYDRLLLNRIIVCVVLVIATVNLHIFINKRS